MMRKIKLINRLLVFLMATALLWGCQEDDYDLGKIVAPSNLNVTTEIVGVTTDMPNGDGSGTVNFTANAENVMTYKFVFSDGFEVVSSSGKASHDFSGNGVNDYSVTVVASGTGGISSSKTKTVTVFSNFNDPETKQLLTGGSSKTWYVAASQPGHLGVGPSSGNGFDNPGYYSAGPFEKSGNPCFYNDAFTFSLQNDEIKFEDNNEGQSFFNAAYVADFGGGGPDDQCLDFDTSGLKNVSLSPSTSGIPESETTGTVLNISGDGFLSYYIGASSYEILSIDENSMYVRAIMGSDPTLAWYLKFTTSQDGSAPQPPEESFETEYTNLVWSDEFDNGPLDPENWNYELGSTNDGWGNNELQYYTTDNTTVTDGNLVITAKAESESGYNYTSSRITTKDNFEFTYGRIEARAKLPEGGGTWPAIWMLGSNFEEVGWPTTGEIDIMEHRGNEQNKIYSTLHYPGHSGANGDGGNVTISNASSEFHTYTAEWSPEKIVFLVDDQVFYTFANNPDTPFNKDFFIIMNVAMGGNFGGDIDPNFDESSMVVDYVRVYQ